MVFPIEEVVDVIIALGDRPVSQRNFSTPMILTAHNLWSDVTRIYNSADDLASDGFSTSSNVYKMVSKIFGGSQKPTSVVIGKRSFTNYRVEFTVANDSPYTINVKVNSGSAVFTKTFTFTSDGDATSTEISAGLASLIEADVDIGSLVVATASAGVLTIAPTSTQALSVGVVTDNAVVKSTSPDTATDALAAVFESNSDWFFVMSDSHTSVDIQAIAAWGQANKRMFVTSSQETGIFTSATNDVASILQDYEYDNTVFIAHEKADSQFPEASLVGEWAAVRPGATTLFAKTLTGTLTSNISATQANYAKSKNANVYINRGNLGWFEEGKVCSGRFADVIRGKLWLEARMEEDVFALIKSKSDLGKKIPYTDKGVQMLASTMETRLDEAVRVDFLSSYKIDPPFVDDIAVNDRANRTLPDLPFTARLSGAFHHIVIRGYVTV